MLKLYTYKLYHPRYRQWTVLDCPAISREAAFSSAVRFLRRENRRFAKIGSSKRCQLPNHPNHMRLEASE